MSILKVGDKIKIKSLDWYNQNKNEDGDILEEMSYPFSERMSEFCGKIATITKVIIDKEYEIDLDEGEFIWEESMFEEGTSNIDWESRKFELAKEVFMYNISTSKAKRDILMDNAIRLANDFIERYKNFKN